MVPLRRGQCKVIGGSKSEWRGLVSSVFTLVSSLCRTVDFQFEEAGKFSMAGHNPLSKEGSIEGCNCSWCAGGQVAGGSGMDVKEM